MSYTRSIILAALGILASAAGGAAQQGSRGAAADSSASLPTLSIGGRVTIQELRVNSDPRVEINLRGCPLLQQLRIDERSNLPRPVTAGTYRDVVIDAHAAVVLADTLKAGECAGTAVADSSGAPAAP